MFSNSIKRNIGFLYYMKQNNIFNILQVDCRIHKRFKYVQNTGVKGIRAKNFKNSMSIKGITLENESDLTTQDIEYEQLASSAMNITKKTLNEQSVFVIQPYVKWGPKKSLTKPELMLQEAEALIRSIPKWSVESTMKVPLESLEKKQLFGSGKIEEIKNIIKNRKQNKIPFSCVFVSKGTLSLWQKQYLETEFELPVMDRYSVVIQILRLHATSTESKLQVAMAEIPYIWSQMRDQNFSRQQKSMLSDSQKELLKVREKKLRNELETVRSQRQLLRNKRKQMDFPIIAVVGYTNAGKTSLIKALTDEKEIQPRDQLFATLDVTAHAGILPSKLEVIYMDTVGFLSDIPTGLIECFIATLEDAMLADIILHVHDLSHEQCAEQRKHVEETLNSLSYKLSLTKESLPTILNVGNKIDLIENVSENENISELHLVSSKTLNGINDLMLAIEKKILDATSRTKMVFRVPNGGQEVAWLYKNAAVSSAVADPESAEHLLVETVISTSKLQQFKHYFVGSKELSS